MNPLRQILTLQWGKPLYSRRRKSRPISQMFPELVKSVRETVRVRLMAQLSLKIVDLSKLGV
jgi:hypothetical protein